MRISDPRTFGSKLITELQLDAVSGILTTNYETFIKNVLKGTKGAEAPVSYGYAYLDANGKIDTTLLNPIAINDTFTVKATNDDSAKTQLDLVKQALTDASVTEVQRGDVVIVYGATDITVETAEKLCGTLIFVEEVAASAVTDASYKAIYTPAGGIKTINGIAPTNGNVAIDAGDIPYLSGTVETTLGDYNTRITAAEGDIDTLQTDVGTIKTDLTVIKGSNSTSGSMQYYAKIAADAAELAAITSGKEYTDEQIAALSGAVDTEIDNLSGTVDAKIAALSDAISSVDKFIEVATMDDAGTAEDTLYYTADGQCAIYNGGKLVNISIEAVTEITEDTANDTKVATVKAIKDYISGNTVKKVVGTADNLVAFGTDGTIKDSTYKVSADAALSGSNDIATAPTVKSYVDDKITKVKEEAIKITSVTHPWTDSDKSGQTYTWTTAGRVIQICDASGWVFPEVQFLGSDDAISSKITVEMETTSGSITGETWTYYIASKLA